MFFFSLILFQFQQQKETAVRLEMEKKVNINSSLKDWNYWHEGLYLFCHSSNSKEYICPGFVRVRWVYLIEFRSFYIYFLTIKLKSSWFRKVLLRKYSTCINSRSYNMKTSQTLTFVPPDNRFGLILDGSVEDNDDQ